SAAQRAAPAGPSAGPDRGNPRGRSQHRGRGVFGGAGRNASGGATAPVARLAMPAAKSLTVRPRHVRRFGRNGSASGSAARSPSGGASGGVGDYASRRRPQRVLVQAAATLYPIMPHPPPGRPPSAPPPGKRRGAGTLAGSPPRGRLYCPVVSPAEPRLPAP